MNENDGYQPTEEAQTDGVDAATFLPDYDPTDIDAIATAQHRLDQMSTSTNLSLSAALDGKDPGDLIPETDDAYYNFLRDKSAEELAELMLQIRAAQAVTNKAMIDCP